MGQRGHALEQAVEALFAYNGFKTEPNKKTRLGEVDVAVSYGNRDAYIECKEFNPNSSAQVTRDMISNVAKKAELGGVKNAILITTKPPSISLGEYAREAGVTLRSYDDFEKIRTRVLSQATPEARAQLLIREFSLADSSEDIRIRQRREFLRALGSGHLGLAQVATEGASFVPKSVLLALGGLLVILLVAAVFFETVRVYLIVIGACILFGWAAMNKATRKKRRGRRRSS